MKIQNGCGMALVAAVLIAGCAPAPSESLPAVDCTTTTVPKYSELTIWSLCTDCHASTLTGAARKSAPASINFDTHQAAAAEAAFAAGQVTAGTMPPRNLPQPSEDQKLALAIWAQCGAPN